MEQESCFSVSVFFRRHIISICIVLVLLFDMHGVTLGGIHYLRLKAQTLPVFPVDRIIRIKKAAQR